jgi:hypothetical protein
MSLTLDPGLRLDRHRDLGVGLLEDAGRAPMKVGLMTAKLSTILSILPSIAVGKPICRGRASRILPKTCDSGSQRNCRSFWSRIPIESIAAAS